MAMVMGSAFTTGETLIYDQLHRRSLSSKGLEEYPQQVLKCHEEWTHQISESSEAKVEVVYGQAVQRYIMTNPEVKYTVLPLWDYFSEVLLVLLHEENFRNAQKGYAFRRILVFAAHPQKMFYEQANSTLVVQQDKTLLVAAMMAGSTISHIRDYCKKKLWLGSSPSFQIRLEQSIFGKAI
jgi:hypothetical protein